MRWTRIILPVVALCAALAPLLAARDLPLVDLPNHLAEVSVWNHHGDPVYGTARYYDLNLEIVPEIGHYAFLHAASWVMPVRWANKLFMALAIVGLWLGLRAYLRAHGRAEILAVAGLPLFWNYSTGYGFIAFVAALGPLLWGCALLARLDDARPWPGWRLYAGNAAIGLLLYSLNVLAVIVWIPLAFLYTRRRAVLIVLPTLCLLALQLLRASNAGITVRSTAPSVQVSWPTLALAHVGDYLLTFVDTPLQLLVLGLLGVGLLAAPRVVDRRPAGADRRPLKVFLLLLLLAAFLPWQIDQPVWWVFVSPRIPILCALALIACVPAGALSGRRAAWVVAPLLAAGIVYSAGIVDRFRVWDAKTRDFFQVMDHLPYDPAVLTLVYEQGEPDIVLPDAAWHAFPAYVLIDRGGLDPQGWRRGFPSTVKPSFNYPVPGRHHPDRFMWEKHSTFFEYFLTKDEPPGLFDGRPVKLVAEAGPWRLWKRRP